MKAALVNGKGETPIYGDFMDPQGDEQHIVMLWTPLPEVASAILY
ncbi:hypothetical protein [Rahnella sp. CG8]|nr:hypothetical protein [Rahnella sp. CG8]